MIDNKRILAIVPARGGSKGVKRKNIRPVAGVPLIVWTLREASRSRYLDRVIVSSEDSEIIEVVRGYGADVPFVRPNALAEDATPGIEPVFHALDQLPGYDIVVLLQPTSPLRTAEDIDACLEQQQKCQAPSCVSVTKVSEHPHWMYSVKPNMQLEPLLKDQPAIYQRQQAPCTVTLNGACYVADIQWLRQTQAFVTDKTVSYCMPKSRSLDIDDEEDFRWFEYSIATQLTKDKQKETIPPI